MNVLFAWEFGSNYGHVLRDVPVGLRLRELGHDVVFAVHNTTIAAETMTRHGFIYVQAPVLTPRAKMELPVPRVSISERLLALGYNDGLAVTATTQAWLNMFVHVNPHVVVVDSATTALLAARIAGVPVLMYGSGFEIPPCARPMPWSLAGRAVDIDRLEIADAGLLRSLNIALRAFRGAELESVAELLERLPVALTTFAELDHYENRASGTYVGHIAAAMPGSPPEWEDFGKPKIVAYLRPHMGKFERVVKGLMELDAEIVCICPTGPNNAGSARPGFRLLSRAVPLGPLLLAADGVASYGGAGLVAEALLAGVPLVLFPELTEQSLNAERVQQLGAGTWLPPDAHDDDVGETLTAFATQLAVYRSGAAAFRERYKNYSMSAAVETVATWITKL